jgi:hypothetical protein
MQTRLHYQRPGERARATRALVLSVSGTRGLALHVGQARAYEARRSANWLGNLVAPVIITGSRRQILESHQTDSVRVNGLC